MRSLRVSGALRHRNFFIFYTGYAVSMTGSWIQTVTTAWLVYSITGSGFWLGAVTFAGQIPAFIFAPFGGVLADRYSRQKLVFTTQVLLMVQALIMGTIYMTGMFTVESVILLEVFLGIVKAIDVPARQAFISDLVDDSNDINNAIALNSIIFNSARLAGPLAAALIISLAGGGWSYIVNGISFTAVVISLRLIKINKKIVHSARPGMAGGFLEGFDYALNNMPVIILILSGAFFNFLPVMVLYPVFAHDILTGNSGTYGLMVSVSGMGALTGAVFLANRRSCRGLGSAVSIAAFTLGFCAMFFSFSSTVSSSCIICFVAGGATMILNAGSNTILQRICDPSMRGRVLSLWIMAAMGASPLGSIAGGIAAQYFGVKPTYLVSGLTGLFGVLFFYFYLPCVNKALAENISCNSA